jgi:hypothetical protein
MLHFKEGVGLAVLKPQMLIALRVVEDQMNLLHCDTIVTSCNDSQHMAGSKHYSGAAFDFRTRHTGRSKAISDVIRKELGSLGFDVILEDLGGPNEHLHVEYDPK